MSTHDLHHDNRKRIDLRVLNALFTSTSLWDQVRSLNGRQTMSKEPAAMAAYAPTKRRSGRKRGHGDGSISQREDGLRQVWSDGRLES